MERALGIDTAASSNDYSIASCEATAEAFTDEPGKSLADYLRRLEQEWSREGDAGPPQSP